MDFKEIRKLIRLLNVAVKAAEQSKGSERVVSLDRAMLGLDIIRLALMQVPVE